MSKRRYIPIKTKFAAALCQMLRPDENGNLVPVIPYEEAKRLTEDEVIARFDLDHYPIKKVDGGPDAHWNLQPRPRAEHRKKTAQIDIPAAAKSRRIARANATHHERMTAKTCGEAIIEKPRKKWPSKPFPKGRGFQSGAKR